MGGPRVAAGENVLNQANIPTFAYPDMAARIFNYMWHYAYNLMGGHNAVSIEGGWEPKRVLGTVPVEEDGSALFRIPANTPGAAITARRLIGGVMRSPCIAPHAAAPDWSRMPTNEKGPSSCEAWALGVCIGRRGRP